MKKIISVFAAIVVIGAFAVSTSFAGDKNTPTFATLKSDLKNANELEKVNLLQVGDKIITNKDLEKFKAFKKSELALKNENQELSEADLYKELILEELLKQKIKEENINVTIDEAIKHTIQMRELLNKQPQDVQDFQQKVIETTGLDEQTYWDQFAPKQYQEELGKQKLVDKLVEKKIINNPKDFNQFGVEYNKFLEKLYEEAKNNKIIKLDTSITLK